MKKTIVAFLILTLFTSTVAFTAGSREEAADGPTIVNHWYWVPNADEASYMKMIDEFNETHPDIQVVWENLPHNEARTKLISAYTIGGDGGPDSFGVQEGWMGEFNSIGMFAPLDEYLDSWENKDQVFPALMAIGEFDGVLKTIPFKSLIGYMYYRVDWFEEEGIEVPETIDELIDAAVKLTGTYIDESGREVERYGYGLRGGAGGGNTYYLWCQTYGADIYDEDGNVAFNSPMGIEATQKYIDLFRELKVAPPSAINDGFSQIIGAFKSGRTAILQHHIGTHVEIEEALGDRVGVMTIPAGPDGTRWTEGGYIGHGISPHSTNKEEAFKFISWMAEKWAVEVQSKELGSIPITEDVANLPYFTENRFFRTSIESIPFSGAWPKYGSWGNISSNETVTLLQRALMGEISAEEMVNRIAVLLEEK